MPLVLGWRANIFTGEFSTLGSSVSDIWAPISYVLSTGLGFATILTLIITPVMLAMPTVLKKRILKVLTNLSFQKKKGYSVTLIKGTTLLNFQFRGKNYSMLNTST